VFRILAATVALTGLGLVATATGAAATSAPAAFASGAIGAAAPLSFDINGPWTDNGSAKPVITAAGDELVIDMSYAHRPTASGHVIDASSIFVTFPDAGPFIGIFLSPTAIRWSNGSVWQKVFTGPTVIDLNDNWTDGLTDQHISQVNGFFAINMSHTHRPNAVGFAVSPTRFQVSFPDDPNTPFATLQQGSDPMLDRITWSNGSHWRREEPPPGNPQCLLLC
jgi:hypothetical protein